ncbi:MAG: DUF6226 family protein [Galactobacter sp.]|uniref:DUF6226 family protein n=1 Tax=Galactobacter sp. TaxID=2676125 RepID=UPI0025BA915D|nr:DUF6226 family protein [Galactobacter sp.]
MSEDSTDPTESTPWWLESEELTPAWRQIMTEVEEAFAETGAGTPHWESPREEVIPEAWYERVTRPERYEILWARAAAWEQVIMEHEWAQRAEQNVDELVWAEEKPFAKRPVVILEPLQPGGGVLALARTGTSTGDVTPGVFVATGHPLMAPLGIVPDCGCDACDGGSAELIEDLDQSIIPILDGSLVADLKTERRKSVTSYRTPFTAGSSTTFGHFRRNERLTSSTSPGPWFPDWTPMQIMDPV